MADIPGFIPDSQFTPDAPANAPTQPSGFIPDSEFQSDEDKYGGAGQQAIAGIEGAAKGVLGPLATAYEKHVLHVPEEEIRGRAAANPVTSGIGEAAGLGAGFLTGTGEAAVLGKAGEAAASAAGLAAPVSFGAKVGSAAVKAAVENAVLQGGDEVSKQILNDPEASAQSAITNVGLAGVLGGVAGGALGTVSPLWQATFGPGTAEFLSTIKGRLNRTSGLVAKDGVEAAAKGLGIELDPLEKAVVSEQGPMMGTAYERENAKAVDAVEGVKNKVSDAVANSLGVNPEEVLSYDKANSGELARQTFENEFRKRLAPIQDKLEAQAAEDAHIGVSDDDRLDHFGKMVEQGQSKFTPTSEYAKEYEKYGQALLDAENIQGVTKIESELGNRLRGMQRGAAAVDYNTVNALQDIKASLRDFREKQIEKSIMGVAGEEGKGLAREAIAEKLAVRKEYAQAARIIDEAVDHFDLGHFEGGETLAKKIARMSPEQAAKKFSFKNNMVAIPFLKEHFPQTYEVIRQNEAKEFLKAAIIKGAKKGTAIDINKLSGSIADMRSGQNTYLQNVVGEKTLNAVQHAKTILNAIPDFRSSKTGKWAELLFSKLPGSALAAISFMTGHSPIGGFIAGETAQRLATHAPDAIKLKYLNWLGSDQPVNSAAFKAGVDFLDASIKGQATIQKASKAIFKPGAMVLSERMMPSDKDRAKLDKAVVKAQTNPNQFMEHQADSHLGHYMPDHQSAMSQSSAQALQYLNSIKPVPHKLGPLDNEVPPQPVEIARYNRALDIAQQPAIVMQHIKNGTLQPSDIKDLNAMYPALYQSMSNSLTNALVDAKQGKVIVPYKTRIGISLFLGQPIDMTMQPMSIIAAQPMPTPMPAAQGGAKGKTRKGTSTLGKSNSSYMTSDQNAESDRSGRE